VKNVMNTVSNIVDILALLKWNSEMRQDKDEYCVQKTWVSQNKLINKMSAQQWWDAHSK